MSKITLPYRKRGGQPKGAEAKYNQDMIHFTNVMKEEQRGIDFKVGTRGWCYILEGRHLISKGDFDLGVEKISEARKSGLLPIDFSADDPKRKAVNVVVEDDDVEDTLDAWKRSMLNSVNNYIPELLSDHTLVHFEVMVEKTDLVGLFKPVCEKYQIPITNIGGQPDINSRVKTMRRCSEAFEVGKRAIILYCGDHDPSGLDIANTLMNKFQSLEEGTGINPSFMELDIFGLTYEYIMENDLVWVENLDTSSTKKTGLGLGDKDHPDHYKPYVQNYINLYGVRKVEANALLKNIDDARSLLEGTILKYIEPDALDEYDNSLIQSRGDLKEAFEKLWEVA